MPTPYAGNQNSYPESVNILAGGDAPNTANFNTSYEGTLDRTAYLRSRVVNLQNWQPVILATSPPVTSSSNPLKFFGACWNPNNGEWAIVCLNDLGASDGKPLTVYHSFGMDAGSYFTSIGHTGLFTTVTDVSITQDPNNLTGYILVSTASNVSGRSDVFKYASGSWSNVRTFTSDGDNDMCSFGGYAIYATVSTTLPAKQIGISSSNNSGSTWSDYTFALTNAASAVQIRASSALAIAIPLLRSASLAMSDYFTSPDGVTWTHRTFSFLGAHDFAVGVTWLSTAALWILGVQTAYNSGATTAFYSSPDGVNWTLIGTGPAMYLGDIASLGPTLICSQQATSGVSEQIYSEDGGVTWYLSQGALFANESGSYLKEYHRFSSSPTQVMAFNSLQARFSTSIGVPSVHL